MAIKVYLCILLMMNICFFATMLLGTYVGFSRAVFFKIVLYYPVLETVQISADSNETEDTSVTII